MFSKFFDNSCPIMHHLHQNNEQARLVDEEGKPEGYYFPPQLNATSDNFPILTSGSSRARLKRTFANLAFFALSRGAKDIAENLTVPSYSQLLSKSQ